MVACFNKQPMFLCGKTLESLIQDSPCTVSLVLWSSGLILRSLVDGYQHLGGKLVSTFGVEAKEF